MVFLISFQTITIKGKCETSDKAPLLCAAPHSSFFDTVVIFYLSGLPSIVSKEENKKVPIFSALMEFTQPVYVKREDPNSRQNTIQEIKRRAETGGDWPQIVIFPEGTCTNRSCLITFKPGAFYPGVPVQPVCLKYPNRLDTITWTWEGPGAFTLLWLTLCQINTRLEIEFLPVYNPSKEEIEDPKLYANNVRAVMARALGVPITDHTYDDCRLMMAAQRLNLPMEVGIIEFHKLHKKLGISLEQINDMLEKFSSIDLSGKGHITLEEFSKYLQVPVSDSLKEVYNMYDRDGSGSIDFREYVIGLSLVSTPANTDSTISLAFQIFDPDNEGHITLESLHLILHNAFAMTEVDVEELFNQVDADQDGIISFEEFKAFAEEKPEYAPLFMIYQELTKADTNGNAKLPSVTEESSEAVQNHIKSE